MELLYRLANVKILLMSSIFLYLFTALISLILIRKHKASNIISNVLCILGSLFSFTGSLIQILSRQGSISIVKLESLVPFTSIDIRLDHLSAFFILTLSILVICVSIYSIGYISHYYGKRNVGLFNFLYAIFIFSMLLVFSAGQAVFFFIAWEAMAVLSYFLVIFESEHEENRRAGTLYIIMTHLGTALIMIAFMMMYCYTGSFDIFAPASQIPEVPKNIMFFLFLIGFGTKAGIIPVHIWLPYAHPAAPSNVSALMSGIMIKTAVYGMVRFVFGYLGIEHTWWGMLILIIGIISAVLGVAYAYVERNIKRLLAYSSIENMGIIYIALGVAFIAFAEGRSMVGAIAIAAGLIHTFNHALFKGSLFLGAGSIQFSAHTKNMEELGGLIKKMPIVSLFLLGGSIAASALIPFNGFIGEWLIFQSLFFNIAPSQSSINIASIIAVAALASSGALAAGSYIKFFGITFLGLPRGEHVYKAKEVPAPMNIGAGILVILCLLVGLFPIILIKIVSTITNSITGQFIMDRLQGGFLIAYYKVDLMGNVISTSVILLIIVLLVIAALIILRILCKDNMVRKYGTWDCGFEALNARMQYTATGFSGPLKIVFKILYCPSSKLELKGNKYHPKEMEYSSSLVYVFEKYFYDPIITFANQFSRRAKFTIQTGSIHSYLVYIFVAVLAMMLYNRLV